MCYFYHIVYFIRYFYDIINTSKIHTPNMNAYGNLYKRIQ